MCLTRNCLRNRFENMLGQSAWFQCAQDIPGFGSLTGGSMSNDKILAGLHGGLILHDAVLWNAYTVETAADGTQPADHHCSFQAGDGPCHQRAANQNRPYARHPKECGAEQQAPQSTPESAPLAPILHAVPRVVVTYDLLVRVIVFPDHREPLHVKA